MSYTVVTKFPPLIALIIGLLILWLVVIAGMAASPVQWAEFSDGPGPRVLRYLPREVVMVGSGILIVLFVRAGLKVKRAAEVRQPLVTINEQGITFLRVPTRPRQVAWSEVKRIEQRRGMMSIFGGSSGKRVLGRVPTVGEDLTAMRRVIAHHRPDLANATA